MHLKRTITYTTLLFLFCFFTSWSKTPSGITTSVGDSTTITICEGDSVTFTLDRVSGIAEGYDFSSSPIKTDEITFTVQTLSGSSFLGGTIDQPSQFNCPGLGV